MFLHRDGLRAVRPTCSASGAYLKPSRCGPSIRRRRLVSRRDAGGPRRARWSRNTSDCGARSGRGVRSLDHQHRGAYPAQETAGGLELALLPRPWWHGVRRHGAAFRRSEKSREPRRHSAHDHGHVGRGSSKHTRQQDEADRLKANVNLNTWGSGLYMHVETTRNLPAAPTLMTEVLREPAFDANSSNCAPRGWRVSQQRSEPSAIAFTAFQKHLNPIQGRHPPRGRSTRAWPTSR